MLTCLLPLVVVEADPAGSCKPQISERKKEHSKICLRRPPLSDRDSGCWRFESPICYHRFSVSLEERLPFLNSGQGQPLLTPRIVISRFRFRGCFLGNFGTSGPFLKSGQGQHPLTPRIVISRFCFRGCFLGNLGTSAPFLEGGRDQLPSTPPIVFFVIARCALKALP